MGEETGRDGKRGSKGEKRGCYKRGRFGREENAGRWRRDEEGMTRGEEETDEKTTRGKGKRWESRGGTKGQAG